MATGDARAIGDWFRGTRYTKDQVDEFFILYSQGLAAYDLTFLYFTPGASITLVGETSTESYSFKALSDGSYHNLFFFEEDEIIDIYDGATLLKSYTLSSRQDTIYADDRFRFTCVFSHIQKNYEDGAQTFVAPKDGVYLLYNECLDNSGWNGSSNVTSDFVSTKEPFAGVETTHSKASSSDYERTYNIKLYAYALNAGDEVQFTNGGTQTSYEVQTHAAFLITSGGFTSENDISLSNISIKKDDSNGTSKSVTLPAGVHFVVNTLTQAGGGAAGTSNIVTTGANEISRESLFTGSGYGPHVFASLEPSSSVSITFNWSSVTYYVGRGYLTYLVEKFIRQPLPSLTNALTKVYQQSSGTVDSVFTAQEAGLYLFINMAVHNSGDVDRNVTASFVSNETPVIENYTEQIYVSHNDGRRNIKVRVGVFNLQAGDTVTLRVSSFSSTYKNTQVHNVFKVSDYNFNVMKQEAFEARRDNTLGASKTLKLHNSNYLAIGFVNNTDYPNQNQDSTITTTAQSGSNLTVYEDRSVAVTSVAVINGAFLKEITFNWVASTAYVTSGYLLLRI